MKLGMDHIGEITEEKLRFLQQMGVEGIMATPQSPLEQGYHEYSALVHLKTRVEAHDMKLGCIGGNTPWEWNYKWMLGLPDRDEQIQNIQRTIRNVGAARIPVYTYNIHALRFYRTSAHTPVRGGAMGTSFDADLVKDAPLFTSSHGLNVDLIPESHRKPIGDDRLWDNLRYFLDAVLPVAEKSGVKLGLHPDDPQVPAIGGVARIMRSPEAFRRIIEMYPSDSNGLLFCVGCFTEMGANVPEEIRYFAERGKINWVHFRNISGTKEKFVETFPDCGNTNMYEAMKAFAESGYEGYLAPDHRLRVEGDSDWGHRYWAYGLGFIRALLTTM